MSINAKLPKAEFEEIIERLSREIKAESRPYFLLTVEGKTPRELFEFFESLKGGVVEDDSLQVWFVTNLSPAIIRALIRTADQKIGEDSGQAEKQMIQLIRGTGEVH